MTQRTSIETYYEIKNSGLLSEKRWKVYDIFYQMNRPLTGAEVSQIYKANYPSSQHSETIRNRITELKEMGLLAEFEMVDCTFTGRKVYTFVTTNNLPEKLEKKETLNQKLDKILEEIKLLGISLSDEEAKEQLRSIYKKVYNLKK
jgi:DNA-binding transcriptional regulator YhcF (GntR family)